MEDQTLTESMAVKANEGTTWPQVQYAGYPSFLLHFQIWRQGFKVNSSETILKVWYTVVKTCCDHELKLIKMAPLINEEQPGRSLMRLLFSWKTSHSQSWAGHILYSYYSIVYILFITVLIIAIIFTHFLTEKPGLGHAEPQSWAVSLACWLQVGSRFRRSIANAYLNQLSQAS